jgi:hypothetical protein
MAHSAATTSARLARTGQTAALLLGCALLPASAMGQACDSTWHRAALTTYDSYPDPGSEECLAYSGCTWAGQFYGISGVKSRKWVAAHNIAAVHLKDWQWLGLRVLRLRQGNREIDVQAIDACSDADCNGCCTANLGGDGFLIDIERSTMERFGSGEGIVEFQVCGKATD